MKIYLKYFCPLLCFLVYTSSLAFSQNLSDRTIAKLEIIIQDKNLLNEAMIETKLYPDGINTLANMNVESISIDLNEGGAKIMIPLSRSATYGRVYLKTRVGKNFIQLLDFNRALFLFEPGDDIKIVITKSTALFEGNGSNKYEAAFRLSRNANINHLHFVSNREFLEKNDYLNYFKGIKKSSDSLFKIRKQVLDTYRPQIKTEIYNLMLADIWADYNAEFLRMVFANTSTVGLRLGPVHLNAVKIAYKEFSEQFNRSFLPDSVLVESYKYADLLFQRAYLTRQAFDSRKTSSFIYNYNFINENYSGIIRDKVMLINFYKSKITEDEFNTVRENTIRDISDPLFRNALVKLIANSTGMAYPFELPDRNGKIHRLKDFKGKLVVIDFWYTGCINCIELADKLKPIVKELRSHEDIVFISVSIDGDKYRQTWLASLEKELYSSKDEINLLAQGKTSEMVLHYNITGYPRLLVVSKSGKVITLSPPDPRRDAKKFKDYLLSKL